MVEDEVRKGKEWLSWFCPHIAHPQKAFMVTLSDRTVHTFVIIQLFRLLMDRMEQKWREGGERGLLFLHPL